MLKQAIKRLGAGALAAEFAETDSYLPRTIKKNIKVVVK